MSQNPELQTQCERSTKLATAEVRKDTPSLIDLKGLGRQKEFTGREWSKQTEASFAGVIKESDMMLEWAAEQATEITTTAIDLEFFPTDTNVDREVQNLEFVLQQMHTALMALTSYEGNDIVANSRKKPLEAWRLTTSTNVEREVRNLELVLQQMHPALSALTSSEADDTVANWRENPLEAWRRLQKRLDPTTGGRKGNLISKIIFLGRCSLLELQAWIERWESYVSRCQKKLKDTFDDEIRLVGLEALVPEELEKHLIVTSNRLRTFEDVRLKIVTYVETMFCFEDP